MAGGRNNGVGQRDFLGQGLIAEVLAAVLAIPIGDVAGLGAGGGLSLGLLGAVAGGRNNGVGQRDFLGQGLIAEILAAVLAIPIGDVAGLGAGGGLGLGLLGRMDVSRLDADEIDSVLQDYVSAVDRDNFDVDIEFTGLLEGDTELAGGVHQGESGGRPKGIAGQLVPFAVLGFKVLELLNLGGVIGEDTLDHGAGLAAAGGGDGVFHGLTDGEGVGLGDCQGGRGLAYKGNGVLQDYGAAVDRDNLDVDIKFTGLLEGDTELAGGVHQGESGGRPKGIAGQLVPFAVLGFKVLELLNLGGVIGEDTLDHGAGVVAAGGGDGEFSRFTDNKGVGCRHRQGGVVKCENGDRNQTHCHGHRKDDCQQLCLFLQKKNLLTFLKPIVCHIPNRNGRHLPFLTSSF